MKLGYCINMSATATDTLGINTLDALIENNFDYVEFPLAQTMELDDTDFEATLKHLKNIGIPCEICNNFFPAHLKLTGPDVPWVAIKEYLDKAISRANKLGAKVIVFGSSGARNVEAGFDIADAVKQLAAMLEMASAKAAPYGIYIAIESLNRAESNIINNLTEGSYLAKLVNRPNVGNLADYYHMAVEKESVEVIKALADGGTVFLHTHIADTINGRSFPLDKTRILSFVNALKSIGYAGRISIEGYSANFDNEIKLAKETLGGLMS